MPRICINALPAALLLAAMLPGSAVAASPPPDAQSSGMTAQVLDPEARIYAERDPFSAPLGLGTVGEVYAFRARSAGWCEVALPDGRTGWIVERHVVVRPVRVAGASQPPPGTRGEVLGALAGTLVGNTVTGALLAGTILLAGQPFEGQPVHGSGVVSQTTVLLALGACAASSALTPAAAAYGAYTVGERRQPGGNMLTSWAYATAGGLLGSGLGYGLYALLARATGQGTFSFFGLGGLIGTTAGAVIGYENSRPRYARQYGWASHVSPPTIGLAMDSSTRGQTSPALRLNLVALRF